MNVSVRIRVAFALIACGLFAAPLDAQQAQIVKFEGRAKLAPPPLDEQQVARQVATLKQSMAREKTISEQTLSGLWRLRALETPASRELLVGNLSHTDPRVVMLSVDALAAHASVESQPHILALRERAEFGKFYGFRRTIADAAAAYRNADAVGFLVETLPKADGQFERVVVEHLIRLTGENFSDDDRRWSEWWAAAKTDYRGPPATAKSIEDASLANSWSRELPEFFDVPLFAKEIVFVIDRSRSMLSTLDGETRLERAQQELTDVIAKLGEDVEFNIIAFEDVLQHWQPALVPASINAKADAVQFVASLFAGNKTASYDALSRSLSYDFNTELVVFLSDGRPTAGQIVEPSAIVAQITKENSFGRATIDTLGIDTQLETELFMYDLAANNFGRYIRIR